MRSLYGKDALVAVAKNGFGIRVDDPFDVKYRTNFHQDYSG